MTGKRGNVGTSCVDFSGFVAQESCPSLGGTAMVRLITAAEAPCAPSLGDQLGGFSWMLTLSILPWSVQDCLLVKNTQLAFCMKVHMPFIPSASNYKVI